MTPDVRTWAEIDLSAIRHNIGVARDRIGPSAGVIAVLKADAYGHGIAAVAPAIADLVDLFGVANVVEAQELASMNVRRDILLLSPCLPAERRAAIEAGFICSVSSAEEAQAYATEAKLLKARLNFKLDTGMGRMGCWQDEARAELRRIVRMKHAKVEHLSTHLPVSDEDEDFTGGQLARFKSLTDDLADLAPGAKIHALNSAGIFRFPERAGDFVRAGLLLYGSACPVEFQPLLLPALTWKARIVLVRDVGKGRGISYGRLFVTPHAMRIATLPVGYADGFPRQVSGRAAQALIGGKRCAVLGRVTMDQILVDVTHVPGAEVGGEAVLIGRQGEEVILAHELAEQAGTIPWDIFTGIKRRVRKFYRNQPLTAK